MACQDLMIVIIINMMKGELYRSESLLTLWQHHSLSILRRNTKPDIPHNSNNVFALSHCQKRTERFSVNGVTLPEQRLSEYDINYSIGAT